MSSRFKQIERNWVKIKVFLSHPREPFKVSQSVSQKNRPNCAKENWRLAFPGPLLLKPRPSQVSLDSRTLGNVVQVQANRAQLGQDQSFPKPPSRVSQSVSPGIAPNGIGFPWATSSKTKAVTS